MRFLRICLPAIAFLFMATAMNATGATVLYTDRGLFEAELIGPTLIDFNDQVTPPDLYTNYAPYPGGTVTLSGVTFTAEDQGYLYAIDPAYAPATYGLGDGVVLSWQFSAGKPNELGIDLPAGTLAVGFDFGKTVDGNPFRFQITFANLDSYEFETTDQAAFAGFISDKPVSRLMIFAPEDSVPQLDRFVFASNINSNIPAVPEPASVALTACGLGILGLRRFRQRCNSRS